LKILLFLENVPEKHKLSPPLAKLLDTHTDTLSNVIMGLWQYVKRNKLQDGEDRRIMVCDEKLLQVLYIFHH
jgi:SWI/SNF-related matrix-associated actin-dependent regulator of chromatin subfamily D